MVCVIAVAAFDGENERGDLVNGKSMEIVGGGVGSFERKDRAYREI